MVALYWGITTLTSIGYGDIAPENEVEVLLCTFLMFVGALSWAYVVAHVIDAIGSIGSDNAQYLGKMAKLNMMLRQSKMGPAAQRKVKAFYANVYEFQRISTSSAMLQELSPHLQGEVAYGFTRDCIDKVWFFKQGRHRFLTSIARQLEPRVYASDEAVFHERTLTIVRQGMLFHHGRLLTKHSTFGDDMILNSDLWLQRGPALSLTAVQLFLLQRRNLEEVLDEGQFWEEAQTIRKAAIRLALIRALLSTVRLASGERKSTHKGERIIELVIMQRLNRRWAPSSVDESCGSSSSDTDDPEVSKVPSSWEAPLMEPIGRPEVVERPKSLLLEPIKWLMRASGASSKEAASSSMRVTDTDAIPGWGEQAPKDRPLRGRRFQTLWAHHTIGEAVKEGLPYFERKLSHPSSVLLGTHASNAACGDVDSSSSDEAEEKVPSNTPFDVAFPYRNLERALSSALSQQCETLNKRVCAMEDNQKQMLAAMARSVK